MLRGVKAQLLTTFKTDSNVFLVPRVVGLVQGSEPEVKEQP